MRGTWELLEPDLERFPALALAYRAGETGGLAPVALNAADEIAVDAFLQGQIGFTDIPRLLEYVLDHTLTGTLTWDSLHQTDTWAREQAQAWVNAKGHAKA